MSEGVVRVVRVGPVAKHPNADALEITKIGGGYPVCMRTGDFKEGDLAIYVPIDSVVPASDSRWAFLQGHTRIKARKLRGIFSMGLLIAPESGCSEGDDVGAVLGIERYQPEPDACRGGQNIQDPGLSPEYDVEGWRAFITADPPVFGPDEQVVVTEKLHGENMRVALMTPEAMLERGHHIEQTTLFVGSHTGWKQDIPGVQWWDAARSYELAAKLVASPNVVFFGELVGNVKGMQYGHGTSKRGIYFFDAMEVQTRRFLDWNDFLSRARQAGLPVVPVLYEGPFSGVTTAMADGNTTVRGASHIREGFVVKTVKERFDERLKFGRCMLKLHGEQFLLSR